MPPLLYSQSRLVHHFTVIGRFYCTVLIKLGFVDHNVLKYTLNTDKPAAAFIRSPVVSQGYKQASKHDHQMQEYQSKCFTFW